MQQSALSTSQTKGSKRSTFLTFLFLTLLLFAGFTNNVKAQINSTCLSTTTINLMGDSGSVNNVVMSDSVYWYSFVAENNGLYLTINNPQDYLVGRIKSCSLYSGTCSSLNLISSSFINPSDFKSFNLNAFNLIIGKTYYLKLVQDSDLETKRQFSIFIRQYTHNSSSSSCTADSPCDDISNGNFESYSNCPNGFSCVTGYVNCWFNPTPPPYTNTSSTSDYFCGTPCNSESVPGDVSVPVNFAGNTPAHSGVAYAGLYAYWGDDDNLSYREYIEEKLPSTLILGHTYNVSMWVYAAANMEYATNSIGICLSNAMLTPPTGSYVILATPQIIAGTIITTSMGWTLVSGIYTATGTENYITIGSFEDDSHITWSANEPTPVGYTGAYDYIDDVSIIDSPTISVSSASICQGQSATLTATSNETGTYSWSPGTGLSSTSGSSVTANPITTTTYTITLTESSGCTTSTTATVIVNPSTNVSISASFQPICSGSSKILTASGASTYSWSTGATTNPITVTPTGTTTYFVTGSNSYGCTSSAFITVHTYPSPIITVTPSSASICSGASTTLTASGATSYSWSTGAHTTSITVSPTGTTSYTVTGTNSNGCTNSAVATVTVNPLPTPPVITGPADACITPITFTASPETGSDGPYTYSWSSLPNGGSTTSLGSGTTLLSVNANNLSPVGGTITCTVTNANGCSSSTTDNVLVCCGAPTHGGPGGGSGGVVLDNTTASAAIAGPLAPYLIGTTVNTGNTLIYINGTFTIDVNNFTFLGCKHLIFGPDAQININTGITFIIDEGSHLYAGCGEMWNGIYIPDHTATLKVFASVIEDAKDAIVSTDGGVYLLDLAKLNKNYIGILVNPYTSPHQGTIFSSAIGCLTNSTTGPVNWFGPHHATTLLPPYAGQRSDVGIELNDVTNPVPIQIGDPTKNKNIFDYMNYGIYSTNSTLTIHNNEFENITYTGINAFPPSPHVGTAIYAIGGKGIINTIIIGGQGNASSPIRNYIHDGYKGIDIESYKYTNIARNTLRNLSATAVTLNNGASSSQFVDSTTISNVYKGVYVSNNYFDFRLNVLSDTINVTHGGEGASFFNNIHSRVNVNNNTIYSVAHPFSNAQGIVVNEAYSSLSTHYVMNNNNIYYVKYGIYTNGLEGAVAATNTISPQDYGSASIRSAGIEFEHSDSSYIESNTITSASGLRTSYWVDGIRFDNCAYNTVTCNYTGKTGSGLYFGGNQPGTYVAKNEMYENGYSNECAGLVLANGGIIYAQNTIIGSIIYPNDNTWLGTYNTGYPNTLSELVSNGNFSPLYVRAGSTYTPTFRNIAPGGGNVIEAIVSTTTGSNPLVCPLTKGTGTPVLTAIAAARAIAKDSVPITANVQASEWWAKHHLYRQVKQDSALAVDPVIQTFMDSVEIANMGILDSINNVLANAVDTTSSPVLASAASANLALSPTDTIESNLQSVYAIGLNNAINNVLVLNASQISALEVIAKECPYVDGPGVYQARALLAPYDSLGTDYTNPCENASVADNNHHNEQIAQTSPATVLFKIFPNPNNGNMTFEYSISPADNGQLLLFDAMGQMIKMYELQQGNDNKLQISESALKNGVYFYRVLVNNITVKSDKLVIIK